MVVVVVFRPRRMKLEIAFLVVSLLEEDVCADPGFFEETVIVDSRCRNIDVYAADSSVFMLDAVDGLYRFQIVVHRISYRVFAGLQCETLVPHILKCDDLPFNVLLRKLFSRDVFVLCMVRAVGAAVDAVVGQIQRCKHNDPVSVEIFLDLFCQFIDFLIFLLDGTGKKYGRLSVGESFPFLCLLDDGVDQFDVFLVLVCISESLEDLFMVDKIICTFGMNVIHYIFLLSK